MLVQEKADQAQALLAETGLDCWLTFARESGVRPDPGVELVVGCDVTWDSAFLFGRNGERIAIVGRYDAANIRSQGVFGEIIGYDEGISQPLIAALGQLGPQTIGLNYSTDDTTADGLTHGMWLLLGDILRDTPYAGRLTSAAQLLSKLRARKSPTEVERMRQAIAITQEIFALTTDQIHPGVSETQIGEFIHAQCRSRNLPSAWNWDACPIVNTGPESEPGHGAPRADLFVQPGHLVHIDFGVQYEGYCSDLQRMWYVRRPGEDRAPAEIERAFATVVQAIEASAAALKPGVRGYQIDEIAREVVVDAGYEEYKHALGHGLGRACHDGGTLLGPRWERYGATPEGIVEAGNVFTLELGVATSAGYVGLEEDVLVTANGCIFLSSFQRELMLI
jgi:Xaa-Pro aminopeptidase